MSTNLTTKTIDVTVKRPTPSGVDATLPKLSLLRTASVDCGDGSCGCGCGLPISRS